MKRACLMMSPFVRWRSEMELDMNMYYEDDEEEINEDGMADQSESEDPVEDFRIFGSQELIEEQFEMIFHSDWCQSRANRETSPCTLPYCAVVDNLVSHMKKCEVGKSCTMPFCSTSLQVIMHTHKCNPFNCSLCYYFLMRKPKDITPIEDDHAQPQSENLDEDQLIPDENEKLIQQQLVLLLHVIYCQLSETQCTVPYCTIMMDIFNHMTTCRAGKSCSEPHCLCSNQILFHWEHCKLSPRCPICDPIRKAYKNASDSNEFLDFVEGITLQAFPSSCDILRAFEALGI